MSHGSWRDRPVGPDPPSRITVVVESPRGARTNYRVEDVDPPVDPGSPPAGSRFARAGHVGFVPRNPANYGFVPGTASEDGDALDAFLCSTGEPLVTGVFATARPVGVVRMVDAGERDDKLVAVATADPELTDVRTIDDLPPGRREALAAFLETYAGFGSGDNSAVVGTAGRETAIELVVRARGHHEGGD